MQGQRATGSMRLNSLLALCVWMGHLLASSSWGEGGVCVASSAVFSASAFWLRVMTMQSTGFASQRKEMGWLLNQANWAECLEGIKPVAGTATKTETSWS